MFGLSSRSGEYEDYGLQGCSSEEAKRFGEYIASIFGIKNKPSKKKEQQVAS
jgi:hypothetical protein